MGELDATTHELSTADAFAEQRVSLVIDHQSGRQLVTLKESRPIVIGRSAPSDVAIDDRSLSRQHVRVELSAEGVWLEDLGSTNGTKLADREIKRALMSLGDVATLGTVRISVHAIAAAADAELGLARHDAFRTVLGYEIERARFFRRTSALLTIRPQPRAARDVAAWCGSVQGRVRPIDTIARYSDHALEVLLPEASVDDAVALARTLAEDDDAPSLVGIAVYPASGTSAEQLLEACRRAATSASADDPVRVAADDASRTLTAEDDAEPVRESPKMREVFEMVERVGRSSIPVLILGETGSGKEVVAQAIHRGSRRSDGPICAVNCAAIPGQLVESTLFGHEKGAFTGALQQARGVFESASGGTVFLDEIGELPPPAQAALLRVLETKRITRVGASSEIGVDVRIVAATHRNIEARCDDGEFRWDLFYRLNAFTIFLPPLRERREEIRVLVDRFLPAANAANECNVQAVTPEAMRLLEAYHWPGNVRELKNAIERAVVLAADRAIGPEHLPARVSESGASSAPARGGTTASLAPPVEADGGLKALVQRYESTVIAEAIRDAGGNKAEAARRLDMPYRTLAAKVRAYGL